MHYPRRLAQCAAFVFFAVTMQAAEDSWRPLLNGTDFSGWTTWLGKPHSTVALPDLARNDQGEYLAPLGADKDPLHVFSMVEIDGQPTLRSSGQIFGYICTQERFHDYHLRLQFRWGQKRWPPRSNVLRDSGLLYHVHGDGGFSSGVWPRSGELQIQEHDCGDLYAIGTQMTVRARLQDDKTWIYDPVGDATNFVQKKPIGNRCRRKKDLEKAVGTWNTIELLCIGDSITYVVNGEVVMRLSRARDANDDTQPLAEGRLALQSEGAEVFYRNVEIRSITQLPDEYK